MAVCIVVGGPDDWNGRIIRSGMMEGGIASDGRECQVVTKEHDYHCFATWS